MEDLKEGIINYLLFTSGQMRHFNQTGNKKHIFTRKYNKNMYLPTGSKPVHTATTCHMKMHC